LHQADSEHVGLLWDATTLVTSNEDPESTVKQLDVDSPYSLEGFNRGGEDRKYVLTARECAVTRQIAALGSIGYKASIVSSGKLWHPDIDEPEIAVADYARVVANAWRRARVRL